MGGVKLGLKPLNSYDVARYAMKNMFKNKLVIIPGFSMKILRFLCRIAPTKLVIRITHEIQKKKVL